MYPKHQEADTSLKKQKGGERGSSKIAGNKLPALTLHSTQLEINSSSTHPPKQNTNPTYRAHAPHTVSSPQTLQSCHPIYKPRLQLFNSNFLLPVDASFLAISSQALQFQPRSSSSTPTTLLLPHPLNTAHSYPYQTQRKRDNPKPSNKQQSDNTPPPPAVH